MAPTASPTSHPMVGDTTEISHISAVSLLPPPPAQHEPLPPVTADRKFHSPPPHSVPIAVSVGCAVLACGEGESLLSGSGTRGSSSGSDRRRHLTESSSSCAVKSRKDRRSRHKRGRRERRRSPVDGDNYSSARSYDSDREPSDTARKHKSSSTSRKSREEEGSKDRHHKRDKSTHKEGYLTYQLADSCEHNIPKCRRASAMDGLWFDEHPHGQEDNMCTEFNPFPNNINVLTHAPEVKEVTPSQFNMAVAVPSKRLVKRIPTGRKLPNFTVDEDRVLLLSWLNVSTNPIVSTGQRSKAYWKRIYDTYNANRGSYPERTQKSFTKRWDIIKETISLFAGLYQQVVNRNQSGTTDSDKITEALTLFASVQERPFTMIHCWNILKNEVKWLDLQNMVKQKEGRGGTQGAGQIPTLGEDGSNSVHVDGSCSSPGSGLGKRPIGRDRAKESRKRSSSGSQSQQSSPDFVSDFVSVMHDMHIEKMTLMKSIEERKVAAQEFMMKVEAERIAMERERLSMMKSKEQLEFKRKREMEEERILAIDLGHLQPYSEDVL